MKLSVNRHLFTQTTLDSGSLTMGLAAIHNFSEEGDYFGTILYKEKEDVGNFQLTIDRECPAMQVNIDLFKLHQPVPGKSKCNSSTSENERRFILNPNGYAIFYVSNGAGGYSVMVGESRGGVQSRIFNSLKLMDEDMFAVTMVRPGYYNVINICNRTRGELFVAYPKIGKVPYRPPNPISIECTKDRLAPNRIKIENAQGQLYRLKVPSRIKIELVEPYNRPNDFPMTL